MNIVMNSPDSSPRLAPHIWIGLVAVAVYVALAAGVANLLTELFDVKDPIGSFLLSHVPVLIPLVIAGLVFVSRAGWSTSVWRTPAAGSTTPRRLWLWIFPALLLIQSTTTLVISDLSRWDVTGVLVALLVCVLIGFGEELYFRGILRTSIRARHGETLALVITSVAFGVAHSFGALIAGVDPGAVLFTVAVTSLAGAVYYGVFRATGTLWAPIALHALDDFSLHISGADLTLHPIAEAPTTPITIATQAVLWVFTLFLLISCIRQDRRSGRPDTAVR